MGLGPAENAASRNVRVYAMPLPACVAGLAAIAAGLLLLVLRLSGLTEPSEFSPLLGRMNPTTALCCILLGLATLLPRRAKTLPGEIAKPVIGALVAMAGALKLLGLATHHDFGIDQFLFLLLRMPNSHAVVAPITAVCLILLGISIPCVAARSNAAVRFGQIGGFVVGSITSTILIGYQYGATSGEGYPTLGGMAAITAVAIFSLAVGVIHTRPHKFIAGIFSDLGPGGAAARRMFLLVIPVTVVIGQLRIISLRFNIIDHVTGITMLTGSLLTVMVGIILLTCNALRINVVRSTRLRTARDAALAAGKAKSEFLATVSHEIRSPLTAVIGFTDLLVERELPDEARHDALRCHEAAQSLLAIVDDILDLSKIEAGKLEFIREPLSPSSIIYNATSILGSKSRAKSIAVNVQQADDVPPWIEGDKTRLLQVLLNLLANAIKFTQNGDITVRCFREWSGKSLLRFEVQDPGVGISAADQAILFEPFVQADRSTTRAQGGTGLGLAISKRLAQAMGGNIGVISEPGKGSTFWFTIELIECEPALQDALSEIPAVAAASANILVAEDVAPIQELITAMLTKAGHRVRAVDDGQQALREVQQSHYDLLLMDMEMPNMDGISATEAIRALDSPAARIPIVALTANVTLNDSLRCRAAGMNEVLQKPIKREGLLAAVARYAPRSLSDIAAIPAARDGGLDTNLLDELEKLLGKDSVAQLCTGFLTQLDIEVAGLAGAADESARHAHSLVGLAGQFGCSELSDLGRELCRAIEHRTRDAASIAAQVTAAARRAADALRLRYAA